MKPSQNGKSSSDRPATANRRLERLKVRHLRLLDLIAREGSLSAAAERMGISQPGATKLLHELETALGLGLVQRSARGGQLTGQGQHALDRLRVALGALDAAATLEVAPELPLVRVGLLPLVGLDALSRVVADLLAAERLPRLSLRVGTAESLVQMLREGEVDCVIGSLGGDITPAALAQMVVTPLWMQSLVTVAAASHPLARRKRVPLADLLASDWVLMPQATATRKAFDRAFLGAGLVPPPARIETESFHIAMGIVAQSRMLSVVPIGAYRQQRAALRTIAMHPAFPEHALVMLTPQDAQPELPTVGLLREAFLRVSTQVAGPAAAD